MGDPFLWKSINEAIKNLDNPAFALSLEIPEFWSVSKKAIYNNLPLPEFDDTGFMGREKDRDSINRLLKSNTRVISIVGEGGVGKTALAQRCLYDILELCEVDESDLFFDIIIWVSLKMNRLTPSGAIEIQNAITSSSGLFQSVSATLTGSKFDDLSDALKEISEYMDEFRILLCIDNLETISGNDVRDFLAGISNKSKVLITTRVGLGEIEYRYKLDKLDDKPSIDLMRNMSKLLNVQALAKRTNPALKELCKSLFNNPLLIKWYVLSIAAGKSPSELINKRGATFKDALKFCFENLYDQLGKIEKDILSIIACMRRPLTVVEIRFFTSESSEIELEEAIHKLHNSSMLTTTDNKSTERLYSLTGVADEYISSVRPVHRDIYEYVKTKRKELQVILDEDGIIRNDYIYNLNAITSSNRDEKICSIYLKKALTAFKKGAMLDAEKYVSEAKIIMPEFSECYRIHGFILKEVSPMGADGEFRKAIEINPNSAIAKYAYAQFLIGEEDLERAKEVIDEALVLDPNANPLQTTKAWVLTRQGDYRNAILIYESLLPNLDQQLRKFRISTYDQASNCYRRMAEQFLRNQDYTKAKEHISRGISLISEAFYKACYDVGTIHSLCKVFIEAELYFKRTQDYSLSLDSLNLIEAYIHKFKANEIQFFENHIKSKSEHITQQSSYKVDSFLQRISDPIDSDFSGERRAGKIANIVNGEQGISYGFIQSGPNNRYFFHRSELCLAGLTSENLYGHNVSFRLGKNEKGICALDVKIED